MLRTMGEQSLQSTCSHCNRCNAFRFVNFAVCIVYVVYREKPTSAIAIPGHAVQCPTATWIVRKSIVTHCLTPHSWETLIDGRRHGDNTSLKSKTSKAVWVRKMFFSYATVPSLYFILILFFFYIAYLAIHASRLHTQKCAKNIVTKLILTKSKTKLYIFLFRSSRHDWR